MERILIADDAVVDRRILVALLDGEYEIVECTNGREVIDRLERDAGFSCLLLDIRMPEVDGFGVLAYMREKGLLARLPVIALTALTDAADQIACYRAGVCDLLEKPYNQDVLKYKVRYVIDKRSGAVAPRPVAAAKNHLTVDLGIREDRCEPIIGEARKLYADLAAQLRAVAEPYDYEAIRKIAHTLIGDAQNLAYTALYEEALFLDSAAKAAFDRALKVALRRTIERLESF